MGYAFGTNSQGREVGYGVEAVCDLAGCEEKIDRGMAYCCGGSEGPRNAGNENEREPYCGGYFCASHLFFIPVAEGDGGLMVCPACWERQDCPQCEGAGHTTDGEDCELCDTHGKVAQRAGQPLSEELL